MLRSETAKQKHRDYMRTYNVTFYAKNKAKVLARNKAWAQKNPEVGTRLSREWRHRNPDKTRDARMKYKYGLSLVEYNLLLETQKGVCAICFKTGFRRLSVDHHHATGKVRGLLCDSCNVALGLLGEDQFRIEQILTYLKKI